MKEKGREDGGEVFLAGRSWGMRGDKIRPKTDSKGRAKKGRQGQRKRPKSGGAGRT